MDEIHISEALESLFKNLEREIEIAEIKKREQWEKLKREEGY